MPTALTAGGGDGGRRARRAVVATHSWGNAFSCLILLFHRDINPLVWRQQAPPEGKRASQTVTERYTLFYILAVFLHSPDLARCIKWHDSISRMQFATYFY